MKPHSYRIPAATARYAILHLWIAVWLCIVALLAPGRAHSQSRPAEQSYLIDAYQTQHGLPENIVNAIVQTPDGYLWCGTTHGLARFDGVRFTVFDGKNYPQLGSGRIRQLFVDRSGALWISVFEGRLVCLKDGHFTAYFLPPREALGKTIFWISEDEAGALWLTVEDGAVFRFFNGEFTPGTKDWEPGGKSGFRVYTDNKGRLWVTTSSYLARLKNGRLEPVLRGKMWEYQFLCPSRSEGWWLETEGKVQLWRDGQIVAEAGPWVKPDRLVECSLEDSSGHLWVASLGKGIFCYSTNAPVRQITVKDGLGSDLVRALFEDAEGNLWAGTRPGGLNRIRPALFTTWGRREGLSSDLVTAICEGKDGEVWAGIDGEGVNRLKDGMVTKFGVDQGLQDRSTRALLYDRHGVLWLGAWVGGLYHYDNGRFIHDVGIPGKDTAVASLFEDSKGAIWVGQRTFNRLTRLENGVASTIELPNSAPLLDVISITEDSAGNLWVGTDGNGLFRCKDGQSHRFTREDGLPGNTIRSLLAEPDGSLWIGTLDGGLCRFKNGRFVTCATRDGLVDDIINHIRDDGLGFLWFTSFQGIFRVSKTELNEFMDGKRQHIQCVAFGKSDGLPALECPGGFQPSGWQTHDGRLWFPTIKGLVVVDPATVPTNSVAPPVLIEDFLVDGEPLSGDQPARSKAAPFHGQELPPPPPATGPPAQAQKVPPGQHRYDFHFTALNFTAPERVRFRYKLEGAETNWVDGGTQRTATYIHLNPGSYRFQVIACNQAGIWNETGASLNFRVLPYFWQTWWFTPLTIILGAAALGSAAFLTVRYRWQRELRRLETQLSVERERTRIAQDIHDGVGANLTEIAWLAQVAEQDSGKPEEVRAQARKISDTARETVQSFDEIVWAILPENDSLTSLVEYLGRRVDELFENSATRLRFTAPPELPDVVVPAEVRHNFYLACKEALHNVNKHAEATEVRVQVTVDDASLRVEIEDNGRGFNPLADRAAGNGLRNLRKRFQDLGGQFELRSQPGGGTTVIMTIPLTAAVK